MSNVWQIKITSPDYFICRTKIMRIIPYEYKLKYHGLRFCIIWHWYRCGGSNRFDEKTFGGDIRIC